MGSCTGLTGCLTAEGAIHPIKSRAGCHYRTGFVAISKSPGPTLDERKVRPRLGYDRAPCSAPLIKSHGDTSRASESRPSTVTEGSALEIELTGAIAPMIALGTGNNAFVREPFASSVKVVAGAGFDPAI